MRRLSAIMFTDMVGYSALTQKNEALALDLLEEHRKIVRPFFEKHDGREIETAGDSFFVEFNSAVESTNCAIEIQTALNERNKTEMLNDAYFYVSGCISAMWCTWISMYMAMELILPPGWSPWLSPAVSVFRKMWPGKSGTKLIFPLLNWEKKS